METGLSISYISDILNEKSSPSLDTLKKLSDSFGVPLTYVMEGELTVYSADSSGILCDLLQDFSRWPDEDQKDLLDYIQAKKDLVRLEDKKNRQR